MGLSKAQQLEQLGFVAGHEVGHLVEHLYRTNNLSEKQMRDYKKFVDWTSETKPQEARLTFDLLVDSSLPKSMKNHPVLDRVRKSIENPVASKDVDIAAELRANLTSVWALAQSTKGLEADRIMGHTLMPRPVARFMKLLTDFGKKVYGAIRGSLYGTPKESSAKTRQQLFEMKRMLSSLKKAQFRG